MLGGAMQALKAGGCAGPSMVQPAWFGVAAPTDELQHLRILERMHAEAERKIKKREAPRPFGADETMCHDDASDRDQMTTDEEGSADITGGSDVTE